MAKLEAMITAIAFVQVESSRIPEVAQEIANIDGVSEVYSVTGDIDLVVMVRLREFDEISSVISDKLNKVEGVIDTSSHLAFRAYSKVDLEATFNIGE